MRASTMIVAVLFGVAVLWLAGSWLLPSPSAPIVEHIAEQKSGKAVIPAHLDEEKIRDKARKSDQSQ